LAGLADVFIANRYANPKEARNMAKSKTITLHRQSTKVRKVQVRNKRIAITLYLDKTDALRLAKEIDKRWGKKKSVKS
jgi:hypothetical protein